MTVGEYLGIFLCYSPLTLSHLCNFTPRAPHVLHGQAGLQHVERLNPPLERRTFDACMPEVRRLGHAGGSSAQTRRRLAPSAVSFALPSAILGHGKVRRFLPSPFMASAVVLVPAIAQYHKRRVNISLSQNLRTDSYEGSPGGGYPPKQPGGRMRPAPNTALVTV